MIWLNPYDLNYKYINTVVHCKPLTPQPDLNVYSILNATLKPRAGFLKEGSHTSTNTHFQERAGRTAHLVHLQANV